MKPLKGKRRLKYRNPFHAPAVPPLSALLLTRLLEVPNCKLSGINPYTWLTDTLASLANGHPANSVSDLMPWTDVV